MVTAAKSTKSLLVIDDDEHMRNSLSESLRRRGFDVHACASGASGIARCREESFDGILCDLQMPGMGGIEVCAALREMSFPAPIVVITAFGSVETAVEAMRQGAFDYIMKPFRGDEVQVVVEKALHHAQILRENRDLRHENTILRTEASGRTGGSVLVGESLAIRRIHELVERYADSSATVLIRGESGVGKEVVARLIHQRAPRKDRPFVCVNCAALSAGLLESELFGHEKGAFTGAETKRQGRFEIAEGGTLLLDEVSEIELRLQAKLLRVLQERTFERVGSSRPMHVDVRVLATSNRNLAEEVRKGRFREDLFFRLNVLPIDIPPLKQRKEDIPSLIRYFLEKLHLRCGGKARRLDPEAEAILVGYDWPGNVRELENVIERAWVLADGTVIEPAAFQGIYGFSRGVDPGGNAHDDADEMVVESFRGLPLKTVERILIHDALRRYGGHQKRTAHELGIGVRTLRTKIKKWDLGVDRGVVTYDEDDSGDIGTPEGVDDSLDVTKADFVGVGR